MPTEDAFGRFLASLMASEAENDQTLNDEHGIVPVIDTRQLWKEEPTRPLRPNEADSFVYDERGEMFCIDPLRGEQRSLFFVGFEADRGTSRYRCPAAALGMQCPARELCEQGRNIGSLGRVIRVPLETNRRIFPPFARHSEKWNKAYRRRTSVERVHSRIDRGLGFELHFIRGMAKMKARVTTGLAVMWAMALGRPGGPEAADALAARAPAHGVLSDYTPPTADLPALGPPRHGCSADGSAAAKLDVAVLRGLAPLADEVVRSVKRLRCKLLLARGVAAEPKHTKPGQMGRSRDRLHPRQADAAARQVEEL